jgi:hypothetical protein
MRVAWETNPGKLNLDMNFSNLHPRPKIALYFEPSNGVMFGAISLSPKDVVMSSEEMYQVRIIWQFYILRFYFS